MTISQIKSDVITAMKAGDALRVSVLRMLSSELSYKQIELQHELSEAEVESVVSREVKKRREAIDSYTAGGRVDQAESERKELEILLGYLPSQLSEDEIKTEASHKLAELPEEDRGDFGKVMRVMSPHFKGKADGGAVAKIVRGLMGI